MRNENTKARLRVATLKELDALVGKYLTQETPQTFWEEQEACLRFETIDEALEAMHDPYFQELIPKEARPHSSLTEVQEFRAYSSDLSLAWEVVARLSSGGDGLRVQRKNGNWVARFGDHPPSLSRSAPVAICLAALEASGIAVELVTEWAQPAPGDRAVA